MRIAVIGTGYVGLVTGACLAQLGHQVTCVDSNPDRVAAVNHGTVPFHEPGLSSMLSTCIRNGRLAACDNVFGTVANSDITFLAVGTPSRDGKIDLSYLSAAAQEVGKGLRDAGRYPMVVVKSTVVPGTTDTLVRGILERTSGRQPGSFGLCMNPEFLREGSAVEDFMSPDRIVIGQSDQPSGRLLAEVYSSFRCPKLHTTIRNAEMIKYASNALLATLISFSNEFAGLCEATPDTDVREVLNAVHLDRRFSGNQGVELGILSYLRAGCGFGGSCLPKDISALCDFAHEHGVIPNLLSAVSAVNAARPRQLLALAEKALGTLRGKTVALLGLAFKPGTDDLRDSPALAVADLLEQKRATIRAFDPMVSALPGNVAIVVCPSLEQAVESADAAIIVTACPEFAACNWTRLAASMRHSVIIDGRNALAGVDLPDGVTYVPIGKHFDSKGAAVAN